MLILELNRPVHPNSASQRVVSSVKRFLDRFTVRSHLHLGIMQTLSDEVDRLVGGDREGCHGSFLGAPRTQLGAVFSSTSGAKEEGESR